MKEIFKITSINLLIFFAFIGIMVFAPIIIYQIFHSIHKKTEYFNDKIKEEQHKLKSVYGEFGLYRYKKFDGKFININKDGNRVTTLAKDINKNSQTYLFFGPSIIWGSKGNDKETIPSIFSIENKVFVKNFAVPGYNVRQSLSKLVNYYIKEPTSPSKRVIIFNDGGTDLTQKINCDNKEEFTTVITEKIKDSLNTSTDYLNFKQIVKPAISFIDKVKNKITPNKESKCFNKNIKFSVQTIIQSWSIANALAKKHGDTFIAVLHPISYEDNLNIKTSKKYYPWKKQAVIEGYPLIREEMKKHPEIKFIDLTKIFTNNPTAYIDITHYSYEGKQIYVKKLTKKLKGLQENK